MDMMDLLKIGAAAIKNNKDDATTGLDTGMVVNALMMVLGGSKGANAQSGGLDIGSIVGSLLQNNGGLQDIVASWVGEGQNEAISPDKVADVIGMDKITEFASMLGLSTESAKGAIADALPTIVDEATNQDNNLASNMLEQLGGAKGVLDMLGGTQGAMDMLGKMFGGKKA